ncbi:MAG TPA: carbohydrate-binding protein, partial [Cytophagales bacterium]
FGPDGALYVLEFGSLWGGNRDSRLVKVEYIRGNRPPVAGLAADPAAGPAPLRVKFSPKGTFDHDKGDGLSYAWSFTGPGTQATGAAPEYVFTKPGTYDVKLTVRDQAGAAATATTRITVGNSIPRISVQRPGGTRFYGDTVHYAVQVEDAEDGSLAAGTIDPARVQVTLEYLPEGNVSLDARGQPLTAALRGATWIAESDCKACHAEAQRSVGPAFRDIAGRYAAQKDDPKLIDQLAAKVLRGGYGAWGEVNMSAHPQLSKEVAAGMVRYILSLGGSNTPPQPVAPRGSFATGLSTNNRTGTYLLRAAYTDQGGRGAGPLSAETLLLLRSPRVPAKDFDQVYEVNRTDILRDVNKDGYALLKHVDLSGVRSITYRVATETKGTSIELRLDSPTGRLVGRTDVPVGKWKNWQDLKVPIEPTSGPHDLYLVFKNRLYVLSLLELESVYFE